MLDLKDRKSLIASLPKEAVVAEIGVAEGCFSEVILEVARPKRLWLIDSWREQAVEVCGHDPSNVSQECHDAKYQQVRSRLGNRPEVRILMAFSVPAAARFCDGYFDWIHLDPNHLELRKDLEAWWPKVKPGGWVTGHDYTVAGDFCTVKTELDQFVRERGLELFVTRGDSDIYEKNYPTWAFRRP